MSLFDIVKREVKPLQILAKGVIYSFYFPSGVRNMLGSDVSEFDKSCFGFGGALTASIFAISTGVVLTYGMDSTRLPELVTDLAFTYSGTYAMTNTLSMLYEGGVNIFDKLKDANTELKRKVSNEIRFSLL